MENTVKEVGVARDMREYRLLLLTTLIISGCSIVYELIISAVSTYLMGNSVWQYSITIGLYMAAMGLGAYLSRYVRGNLFKAFVIVEISVGIVGGLSSLALFMSFIYLKTYSVVMYAEIIVIGAFVGAEIPLLTRIVESGAHHLKLTLSSIFSVDYIGGLVGSIAFPLLLLPKLGYFATSFLCGTINVIAAFLIVWKYSGKLHSANAYKVLCLVLVAAMFVGMATSDKISTSVEGGLYRDTVILSEQTTYQKIVMTKYKDDTRLYLDGNIQFSTKDEYRYHEALVHVPMMAAKSHSHVLIMGGGDGLAAREVLKYKDVEDVTLVDLDPDMTKLCSTHPDIVKANDGSLTNEKMTVINDDASKFIENPPLQYDVIIVDFPDPNSDVLCKLYSTAFYRLCANALADNGVMSVQSTSPYYATDTFWCINKTIASERLNVRAYHAQVPAFGDWGFNLVSKTELPQSFNELTDKLPDGLRFLSSSNVDAMFSFAPDETTDIDKIEINTMSKPVIMEYYNHDVENWN